MSIKEFSGLTSSQRGTFVFRVMMTGFLAITTGITTLVFGYVKNSDMKLTQTASDVAQIKWELPVIKDAAVRDKSDVLQRIHALEIKIENLRSLGENKSNEIAILKTEIAILKQKIP